MRPLYRPPRTYKRGWYECPFCHTEYVRRKPCAMHMGLIPNMLGTCEERVKGMCPLHDWILQQTFSILEAEFYVKHAAALRICDSCKLKLERFIQYKQSKAVNDAKEK